MITRKLWRRFPEFVEAVRQDHRERRAIGGSHDFVHALMTAQYAEIIAENHRTGLLAWIAGMCHNTDRLFCGLTDVQIDGIVRSFLARIPSLTVEKWDLVVEAVQNHSKLNDPADNPVTVTLKDADRLANIGPNAILRSAQRFHQTSAYDPRYVASPDPLATYKMPRTPFNDLRYALEWEPMLRLPRAVELAKPWFALLRQLLAGFETQLQETDVLPELFENPEKDLVLLY